MKTTEDQLKDLMDIPREKNINYYGKRMMEVLLSHGDVMGAEK